MSELRFDPLRRAWVIIAPERGERPSDFLPAPRERRDEPCPFCLIRDGEAPAVRVAARDVGDDAVQVVANRFPALRIEPEARGRAVGPYDQAGGVGAHEVVVESRRHDVAFEDLSEAHLAAVFGVWRDRVADLSKDPRFQHITVFKNAGPAAGATLLHAHSQVIATPVRPTRAAVELAAAEDHYALRGRCLVCDVLDFERADEARIVEVAERFVAYCAYASCHPFAVVIAPRDHAADFGGLSEHDAAALAGIVKRTLRRLHLALDGADYNLGVHSAPIPGAAARARRDGAGVGLVWHWRLEITPRIQSWGGFELTAGVCINPVAPEDAAAHLRSL